MLTVHAASSLTKALDELVPLVDQRVWALIKTVALDNRSLGLLRPPRRDDGVTSRG